MKRARVIDLGCGEGRDTIYLVGEKLMSQPLTSHPQRSEKLEKELKKKE